MIKRGINEWDKGGGRRERMMNHVQVMTQMQCEIQVLSSLMGIRPKDSVKPLPQS